MKTKEKKEIRWDDLDERSQERIDRVSRTVLRMIQQYPECSCWDFYPNTFTQVRDHVMERLNSAYEDWQPGKHTGSSSGLVHVSLDDTGYVEVEVLAGHFEFPKSCK